ncbi:MULTISPECIES: hypothetical protein [Shewanella]|uniref:Uncharacterized protein n=1 Tax=Shewanella vaxholmensis TaxID=3063535 RepID=A0ABU9UQU1_9GAMM|nr:hypothetical protein [Shewanella sp. SP2S2-6]MDT3294941.1 hypothetical protein [Shewanella sp. SP2S2-6]
MFVRFQPLEQLFDVKFEQNIRDQCIPIFIDTLMTKVHNSKKNKGIYNLMSVVTIKSEEDFLELAKSVLLDGCSDIESVVFDGWPSVELYIQGPRYDQSLPISAMEGYVGFQQELYRLYGDLIHSTSSLQKLRYKDKEDLELVFKIEKGSSDTKADAAGMLNHFLEKLDVVLVGMDSMEKILLILGLAGCISGTWIFTQFIKGRTDNAQIKENHDTIRASISANENSTKEALAALKYVYASHPKTGAMHEKVSEYSDQAYRNVLKKVPDADFVRAGHSEFRGNEITEFSRRTRSPSNAPVSREAEFYIDGVERSSDNMYYLIKTTRVEDEQSVSMKAFADVIGDDLFDLLKALGDGNSVKLAYQASIKGDSEYNAQFSYLINDDEENVG